MARRDREAIDGLKKRDGADLTVEFVRLHEREQRSFAATGTRTEEALHLGMTTQLVGERGCLLRLGLCTIIVQGNDKRAGRGERGLGKPLCGVSVELGEATSILGCLRRCREEKQGEGDHEGEARIDT